MVPLVQAVQELSAEYEVLSAATNHADLQALQAQLARLIGEVPSISLSPDK
ncbi:hypothetical protein [Hymenobacter ruricola]|uniref:Uncharacterized protein n=1 Tax=Hymenobacter ruricola TaxID=2791023 RepID=A0ABS0I721_9BACT|nr:hypothetical protein [Hymenobacter ruricola]MBF9222694.1 hypothetical protein [Hymenobacter ruricola]